MGHSHEKRKDSLEGSLDRVLFAAELEFPKILVPRLPQNTSNVNIEYAGKSYNCILYVDSFLEHIKLSSFYCSDINLFLIDHTCYKLCNIWLLLFENNSKIYHYTGAAHWRKNNVAVITQNRVMVDSNLKGKLKTELCILADYSY